MLNYINRYIHKMEANVTTWQEELFYKSYMMQSKSECTLMGREDSFIMMQHAGGLRKITQKNKVGMPSVDLRIKTITSNKEEIDKLKEKVIIKEI